MAALSTPVRPWMAENPDAVPDRTAEAYPLEDYRLEVIEASEDTNTQHVAPDGTPIEPGMPLRRLREILGGDEGFMTHPFTRERVPVSLAPWADANPDTTIVRIGFTNRPRP